jgi:hypothetical protein
MLHSGPGYCFGITSAEPVAGIWTYLLLSVYCSRLGVMVTANGTRRRWRSPVILGLLKRNFAAVTHSGTGGR